MNAIPCDQRFMKGERGYFSRLTPQVFFWGFQPYSHITGMPPNGFGWSKLSLTLGPRGSGLKHSKVKPGCSPHNFAYQARSR
jgi:hypothetical protein